MKKVIETITALALMGAIVFADSLNAGLAEFLSFEAPCLAVLILGTIYLNKKAAETEAPAANTMKRGESRNS